MLVRGCFTKCMGGGCDGAASGTGDGTSRRHAIFDHGQKDAWYLFSDLDAPPEDIVRL